MTEYHGPLIDFVHQVDVPAFFVWFVSICVVLNFCCENVRKQRMPNKTVMFLKV